MKNRLIITNLCVLISSLSLSHAAPTLLNGIKAKVNGEVITQVDLDESVKLQVARMFRDGGISSASQAQREIAKLEKEALDDLIDRKLILSEFKTRGGTIQKSYVDNAVNEFVSGRFNGDRGKFLESLSKQGISLNQFRKIQEEQIAVRALQSQMSRPGDSFVIPQDKKAMYDEIKNDFRSPGSARVQMITIPKLKPGRSKQDQKNLASKLQKQIAYGTRFSTIAKEYSVDQFAAGGGFVTLNGKRDIQPEALSPALGKYVSTLGIEKVSPVIDDGMAWRLLMVNSRKLGSVPSQKELDKQIESRLLAQKRSASMDGWLKKLRRDSNVQIFD